MSIDATAWAWRQCLTPPQKITLLALADCAGETHEAIVDFTRLTADTGMTRSALISAIHGLERRGLLQRALRPRDRVWVYNLVGVVDRHAQTGLPLFSVIEGGRKDES